MLDIAKTAIQILDIDTQMEELKERRDQLAASLIQLIPAGEKATAGNLTVTIRKGIRRLNGPALTKAYPAIQYPRLYKVTLDTTRVKKEFAEAALAAGGFYTVGAPTVDIK